MLKKYILLIMVISVVHFFVAGGVFATEALENDEKRIQKDREAVQTEISDAEASLVELVQELEQLNSKLSNINAAIAENEEMIVDTEEKIRENEEEVIELELDIERLQNDIDQRFQLLKERAKSYQKNGMDSASYIEVVLGSESFGDFVSRLVTISRIAQADSNFITQLESNQQELVDVQGKHKETLRELDDQVIELEYIHANIENERKKAILVRDEVKNNEAEQEAFIVQLVQEDMDLASQEANIRERIEKEVRLQEEARIVAERQAERDAQAKAERDAQAKAEKDAQAKAEKDAQAKAEKDAQATAEKKPARETVSRSDSNSNNNQNDSSGSTSEEGNWRTFTATAYTAYCPGCSGVTFTGIDLRANPNAKVIAVDPNVIPLGSRVEVKGYGTFLAGDTGGAINGNIIDIFMSDRSDALSFGRRSVQIRVLD